MKKVFDFIKVRINLVLIVITVTMLAFVLYSNWYYKNKNEKLLKDGLVTSIVAEEMKQSLDNKVASEKKTEEIVTRTTKRIIEDNKVEAVIRGTLEKKLNTIEEKKEAVKQSPALEPQKQKELEGLEDAKEEAVIDNLWEHYCLAVGNDDSDCDNATGKGNNNEKVN